MIDDDFASDVDAILSGSMSLNGSLFIHHGAKRVRKIVVLWHCAFWFNADAVWPLFADKSILGTERIGLDRVRCFRESEVIDRSRPSFRNCVLGTIGIPECL